MRQSSSSAPRPPARVEIRAGIWLDSRLALWLPAERLLVVADLHWGYAASHHARGNLLPAWGDEEIERRLLSLIADYRPAEMLWLGDVVHAAEGAARAEAFLRCAPLPVTVLTGNHDRRWRRDGEHALHRGCYYFHHGDTKRLVPTDCVEVIGHFHPAACYGDAAGTRVKLPALIAGARRFILPAFSPWAAGVPWNDHASPGETIWAIAPSRIFVLSRSKSAPPAALA